MITLKNRHLRRGAKVLLDSASVTLNPGEKVGLVGRNGAGKSSLFALLNGTLHEDGGDFACPRSGAWRQVAQDMPETDAGAPPTSCSTATPRLLAAQAEVTAAEASDDGDRMAPRLHGPARRRRARRAGARAGADPRPGLQDHRTRQPGQQLLRRLAHAPAAGARADVPVRPAAARRADQPPGPGRAGLAGSLAQALRRHADRDQPRPRVPRRGDQRHAAHRQPPSSRATAATTARSRTCAPSRWSCSSRPSPSSRTRSPTCRSSSTASRPRPARPSRRKAASRRWSAWRRSRRCWPRPTSASSSRSRPTCPTRCWRSATRASAIRRAGGAPDGTPPTVIVRNVSRSVLAGQRIGILGANGQGKSTLVKTIARDLRALGGEHHRRQGPEHRLLRAAGTRRAAPAGQRRWST